MKRGLFWQKWREKGQAKVFVQIYCARVIMEMGKLPVRYNLPATSLSSCLYLKPGISLWHELVLLA